jgi:hypothetical protein
VLSGWGEGCHGYGRLGPGPKPARLEPLANMAEEQQLDHLVDLMLCIRHHFSSPKMLRGGALRPFMHALAATLIMYYPESDVVKEVPAVLLRMRKAMADANLVSNVGLAHAKLLVWGSLIKKDFNQRNLKLTSKAAKDGNDRVADVIQQLSGTINDFIKATKDEFASWEQKLSALEAKLDELAGLVNVSVRASPSPQKPGLRSVPIQAPAILEHGNCTVIATALGAKPPAMRQSQPSPGEEQAPQLQQHPLPVNQPPAMALCHSGVQSDARSSKKSGSGTAVQCYIVMRDPASQTALMLEGNDKARAERVKRVFNAVRTSEEIKLLNSESPREIDIHNITLGLHDRVIGRFLHEWCEHELTPQTLKDWKDMTPNSMANHITSIKSGKVGKNNVGITKKNFDTKIETALSNSEISELPKRPENKVRTGKQKKRKR